MGATISRHLLSFVADPTGRHITIHIDRRGIDTLIGELERIREKLGLGECCDTQLFGYSATDTLTQPPVPSPSAAHPINHVKIYGWTEKWLTDRV